MTDAAITSELKDRLYVLRAAADVIHGDREQEYGGPESNFLRIANYWNAFLNNRLEPATKLEPWEVAIMMDLMKTARIQSTNAKHYDSWVDKVGYAANGFECVGNLVSSQEEYLAPHPDKDLVPHSDWEK